MSDVALAPVAIPPLPFDAPNNPYLTVEKFRADFPVFEDATRYTDASVQTFINVAGCMVSPNVWGSLTVFGQELLVAHFLSLQARIAYGIETGGASGSGAGVPGMPIGLMGSKSVSKVSVSYDYGSSSMAGWGPFNLTSYGQQWAFYAQMAGTGGYETLSVGLNNVMYARAWEWGRNLMAAWSGVITR